jgi:hypothetical protein
MTHSLSRRATILGLAGLGLAGFSVPIRASGAEGEATNVDPLTFELTGVALPVVNNRALVSYLFCAVLIQVRDTASTFYFRENQFLLRDAIVRIGSRSPIPVGPTPGSFDRVAITRVVLRAVAAVRPSAQVVRVTVTDADFMRN